jgi:hypothetical protein
VAAAEPDVVQSAVVPEGDDAARVDLVVADSVVAGDADRGAGRPRQESSGQAGALRVVEREPARLSECQGPRKEARRE